MRKLIVALFVALSLLRSAPAFANQYEIFIDVEDEEDLYDLLASRQIEDDTFNTLLELLQRGVDLNTADREQLYALPNLTYQDVDSILRYRHDAGFISDPSVLAKSNVISKRKFIAIAPFLVIRSQTPRTFATNGRIRAQTVWTTEDDRIPATAVLLRLRTLRHVSIGVLGVVTRNRIGSPVYDPNRDALVAEAAKTRLDIPKFYVEWDDDQTNVIVGSFTAGFGERLVYDTTPLYTPNGIYADDSHRRLTDLTRKCKLSAGELPAAECDTNVYVTPDFAWTDYNMGVAAGIKGLKVGPGKAQAYGFVSLQPLDVYQYQLYDRSRCDDPRNDNDPNCSAPDVHVKGDDPLAPANEHSFQTLPNILRELVVGGNLAYRPQRRVQFGVTGYGAKVKSLAQGIDLDWQEWSSRGLFGGPFGAVGVYGAVGHKWLDAFVEIAQSFDSMAGGGGGPAGVARVVASKKHQELELSFRYFDQDYANPFGGAYAQADTLDGLRDRDEIGARLRYAGLYKKKLNLRTSFDVWNRPSLDRYKTQIRVRADYQATSIFGYGLWLQFDDRDIGPGPLVCETIAAEVYDTSIDLVPACGQSWRATGRLNWKPMRKLRITTQYQHEFIQDQDSMDQPRTRQDISAYLNVYAKPSPELAIRGRVRYLFEDITDNSRLEQSIWIYVNLRYRFMQKQWFQLRYDLRRRLDDRMSTAERVPRTESWLWAQYESKF